MELVKKITAPNPGVFTGGGTNTYLVGREDLTLIDPGPNIKEHIDEIIRLGGEQNKKNFSYTHPYRSLTCSITNLKNFKSSNVWKVG
jgi:hypothetical protein